MTVLAITGGVGGAKLALGLSRILKPHQVQFLVNIGDDFEHLGLPISPDIDTLLYTLSDRSNKSQGWGRAHETWTCMEMLAQLGGETWFRLGDKDIALHLQRRNLVDKGKSLTQVVSYVADKFGIAHTILPASDSPIRTMVRSEIGELPFQEYFVRHHCEPKVTGFHFGGAKEARLNPNLRLEEITGVIFCPSNPYLSIDPILAINELHDYLVNTSVPIVVVSPIVGGKALKGPTAKIMRELDISSSSTTVAEHYAEFLDGLVIDNLDSAESQPIQNMGISVLVCNTVMKTLQDRVQLAELTIKFLDELS